MKATEKISTKLKVLLALYLFVSFGVGIAAMAFSGGIGTMNHNGYNKITAIYSAVGFVYLLIYFCGSFLLKRKMEKSIYKKFSICGNIGFGVFVVLFIYNEVLPNYGYTF